MSLKESKKGNALEKSQMVIKQGRQPLGVSEENFAFQVQEGKRFDKAM